MAEQMTQVRIPSAFPLNNFSKIRCCLGLSDGVPLEISPKLGAA